MIIALAIASILFIGFFLVSGYIVSSTSYYPKDSSSSNNSELNCQEYCEQWQARRVEHCEANALLDFLNGEIGKMANALATASIVAFLLGVSVYATSLIPVVGLAIAAILAIALTVALGFVASFTGQLIGLNSSRNLALASVNQKIILESSARNLVISGCSKDKSDACLATPSPC